MAETSPADAAATQIQSPRSGLDDTVRPLIALAIGLLMAAVAIFLMSLISAHDGIVFGPDRSTRLIAIQVVAVSLLLAVISMGARMRLSMQMILIYMTVYLLIPGYHHTSENSYPFYNLQYDQDIRFAAGVMISVFLVALLAGYILGEATDRTERKRATLSGKIVFPNQLLLVSLSAISVILAIAYLGVVGVTTAFGTRADFLLEDQSKLALGLFVYIPRVVNFVSFAYAYVLFLQGRKVAIASFYLIVNFIPFFITNFPLVLPRYVSFGIVLFFLLVTFDFKTGIRRLGLSGIFLFGALFAMPIVDSVTRREGAETSSTFAGALNTYVNSGDFDGLQSIQNSVIYTEQRGNAGGIQLLSAALFFVPRDLWSGKAQATGEITSRAAGYSFNNISQPFPSELYVDFGMTGMALLTVLFGLFVARLDGWIDRNWQNGPRASLIAGIVVAYAIIVLRGSLLGVVAPVLTFAAGIFFIIRFGLVRPEALIIRRRASSRGEAEQSPRVARHARAVARISRS